MNKDTKVGVGLWVLSSIGRVLAAALAPQAGGAEDQLRGHGGQPSTGHAGHKHGPGKCPHCGKAHGPAGCPTCGGKKK